MFVLKKLDIRTFPFQDCAKLSGTELEEWASAHNLSSFNTWMLPQIQALYGSFRVTQKENGLYDPKLLMRDNVTTEWDIGLWKVITRLKRSALVKSQIHPQYSEYSALVPIILSGLKRFKNIPYSKWDRDGLGFTMEASLYEAATYTDYPDLTKDELLLIRSVGLTTKSGNKMGEQKKATSSWCLTGIKDTQLGAVPKLTGTMLAQIWVAHPTVRSDLMILNPKDWDDMPEPLVGTEVLHKAAKTLVDEDLPWLA